MLTRLYVDNYRCLVNFELKPGPVQLLMGTNGSGKSTVFDVLALLRDISARNASIEGLLGGRTKTRWQQVKQQTFEMDVTLDGVPYRYSLIVDEPTDSPRPRIRRESVDCDAVPLFLFETGTIRLFGEQHTPALSFPFDCHRSALSALQEERHNGMPPNPLTQLSTFKDWLGGLTTLRINPWAMSSRSEAEAREPSTNLDNFADWFRHLKLEQGRAVFEAVAEAAQAIPGLNSVEAKEAGLDVRVVQAEFGDGSTGSRFVVPLHELSEGQRVLLALYVVKTCCLEKGCLLAIDEPDNFVALAEIQPWLMSLLDRMDDVGGQFLVASHHPEVLNQLTARGGLVLERPDGLQTRVHPFPPQEETDLLPSEVVARGWEHA